MLAYLSGVVQHYQLRLDRFGRQQQLQQWKPRSPRRIQHICALGLGELGAAAALYFQQQGFEVSGWSASAKQLADVRCYHGAAGFAAAVADADLVICLLPLTAATENLLDQQAFGQFKNRRHSGECRQRRYSR